MALLEKNLVVKKSTIPGAGKGLFTKKPIPKGELIIEYKGKASTWKDVDHDGGNNGYIYYLNRNFVLDAQNHKTALARYANDAKGLGRVKGISNNCHYVSEGNRVFIESLKNIPANAEILVSYGPEYWDVIRHNIKVDQDAAKKHLKKVKKSQKVKGIKKVNGVKRVNGAKKAGTKTQKVSPKKAKAAK
jgi:SET domain-containing protein